MGEPAPKKGGRTALIPQSQRCKGLYKDKVDLNPVVSCGGPARL